MPSEKKENPKTKDLKWALRPDAQAFDEIRIKTVPRFKESELSGSEWRISASIEFYRKGKLILKDGCGDIQTACGMVYAKYVTAIDHGNGYFAGDGIHCDQEGCSELAKFKYRLKKSYCTGGGSCGHEKNKSWDEYRCFCEKHSKRGDQDREDCDENYELVDVI